MTASLSARASIHLHNDVHECLLCLCWSFVHCSVLPHAGDRASIPLRPPLVACSLARSLMVLVAPPRPHCVLLLQDSSGVSRDEMAAALMEVSEGRIPADRIALRELHREICSWPTDDDPPTRE